jgi:endo-1,4-beta-xylanase
MTLFLGLTLLLSSPPGQDASPDRYAAGELAKLPVRGRTLIDTADLTKLEVKGDGELVTHEIVAATGQPFAKALRVSVQAAGTRPWDACIHSPDSSAAVARGDVLLLILNVRSLSSSDPSGTGTFTAYLQRLEPQWMAAVSVSGVATSQWKRVYAAGVADRDFAAGTLNLSIHLAQHAQKLEVGGVMVLNLGKGVDLAKLPYTSVTYAGREKDAPWRKAAAERIERHRKGDMVIRVVDGTGRPVPDAEVRVEMKRHAFGFGSFIETTVLADTSDGQKYRDWTLKLFNRATAPIYWADWGWANPKMRTQYHAIARWLKDHHLTTRGHVIIYPGWHFLPAAARELAGDPPALRQRVLEHIAEVVQATNSYGFDEYDVTNELRDLHDLTGLLDEDAVPEWFRTTRKYNKTARLALNENTIVENGGKTAAQQDHFAKMIQMLIDSKAGLDVIGIQGHFNDLLTPPDKVVAILDRFARFGKPIHITEFDVEIRDEAAQADYLRDFITAVFSHPATEGLTQWGFWEGQHWRPLCAMIRKDWTLKPNGQAYCDLVLKQWWTSASGKTGGNGEYSVRGFLGDYEVVVRAGGRTKTLSTKLVKNGTQLRCVLD